MTLKKTLESTHALLKNAGVDHALIGAMALAALGISRATADIDYLIDGADKEKVKSAMKNAGYKLDFENEEVLQYSDPGCVDFLLANRPLSRKMLESAQISSVLNTKVVGAEDIIGLKIQAYCNNPKREHRDKADILSIIETVAELDWKKIKTYSELFGQWNEIQKLKDQK